ncbi:hypothetical protein AGMMS50289_02420 [Betaproteobacteria bacterium]|nr:hypothetical protein AGMMS50289_02420 [Betaproteobacteria bacterium]
MLREETNSDSKQVKILIHNYLDPELLKPMKVTEGIGFHLTKPGEQREVHVTVLTISYQDKKIAQKKCPNAQPQGLIISVIQKY